MSGELVDPSVWVDHFRNRNQYVVELLNHDQALTHPMVLGEIACGTPPCAASPNIGLPELACDDPTRQLARNNGVH